MQSSNTVSYYIFSLVETPIVLQQRTSYVMDIVRPKAPAAIAHPDITATSSAENSPEKGPTARDVRPETNLVSSVQIEFLDDSRLRKTRDDTLSIKCEVDFKFSARFYTLSKRPLAKVYRGENFLLRANIEVRSPCDIDLLETYFICDHNLVQSTYSFKRKKFTNTYRSRDKLEDVIVLRTNATLSDWTTAKDFERTKGDVQPELFSRSRQARKHNVPRNINGNEGVADGAPAALTNSHMNKSLMGKISTNMTIINNTAASPNSLLTIVNQSSIMSTSSTSSTSVEDKLTSGNFDVIDSTESATQAATAVAPSKSLNTRVIFNKAIEAIQATGHCRGFFKKIVTTEPEQQAPLQQPIFGVYCIKWRRSGSKDENESKFLIHGLEIEEPPLNIYCTIEEKMFVKMPMTYKVVLRNPTTKVIHLVATLSINNTDNFICSGHKQLDISIYAFGEKKLVYNFYPLCVGWQNLPELTLEYNTNADPNKDEAHNSVLSELVQRSIPKKVFVLPPLKQLK